MTVIWVLAAALPSPIKKYLILNFYTMSHQRFMDCIRACLACAVACNHCATECLSEDQVKHLARCIKLDLECAAICRAAAEMMSLGSDYSIELCRLCAEVCNACAEECEKHAAMGMEHCAQCAEACRSCADACNNMISNN